MVWKATAISQKKPNFVEIGLTGSLENKKDWILQKLNSEISVSDIFNENTLVDSVAVSKGFGTQGPVKRFGITLKEHKSEKGVRRPGSLSSFGLRRVTLEPHKQDKLDFIKE